MPHAITGVNAAAATPFTADGRPDLALFTAHCRALLDEGCHGLAILGTTGEANSVSVRDRMAMLEALREAGVPGDALLPGTGNTAVEDAIALTRHAVGAGAGAALVLPPYYYKGVSDEGLFRFYARVIEGVGSDGLKVILYHIPQISQIPISHDLIERLMAAFPGIVVAIKDSSGDWDNLAEMVRRFPDLSVITGADPLLLRLLRIGGAGCITGAANLCARDLRTVYDGWQDPGRAEEVEAAHERIVAWRTLTTRTAQLATVKALVAKRRGDLGWTSMTPPLVELTDAERDEAWAGMEAIG